MPGLGNLLLTCFGFGMWNVYHKFISNVINKSLVMGLLKFLHILLNVVVIHRYISRVVVVQ